MPTFSVKPWVNSPGTPNVVDGPAMQDLEERLSNYTNLAFDTYQAVSGTAGITVITVSDGTYVNLSLPTSTTVNFSLTGAASAVPFAFSMNAVQGTAGSATITWPSAVKWAGGATAVLSGSANFTDVLSFFTLDGGNTIYGFVSGLGMR